ncbi:MAG: hypothetical protein ACYDH5_01725 [Acidimicrobiales bacterium]
MVKQRSRRGDFTIPAPSGSDGRGDRGTHWALVVKDVARERANRAVFWATALVVTFAYSVLLPFDYTQRLSFANWHYLDAYLVVWSVLLGLAMGVVVTVQVHAMRRVVAARASNGAAGGLAFVVSLLTSCLCCTPFIPTFLAFVGMSGVGLYTTTGALQHFFAVHETEFLSTSLALLAATGWWGLRKIGHAACVSGESCDMGAAVTDVGGAANREHAHTARDAASFADDGAQR